MLGLLGFIAVSRAGTADKADLKAFLSEGDNEERYLEFQTFLEVWNNDGVDTRMGLGLYNGTRFHVDTHRHRGW